MYNNNKLVAKTLVKFEKSETTINFTIPKKDFNGYVSINDASLKYDNTYYFSITKPEKTNVISIGKTDKSAFLNRIYTPIEFNYSNSTIETLDYNTLEKQDAIILNELENLPQALGLGKHTYITIKQNLFWAFFYNIVAIPVAAFGFLTPTFSALTMALSDVVLALNSIRLFVKKVY